VARIRHATPLALIPIGMRRKLNVTSSRRSERATRAAAGITLATAIARTVSGTTHFVSMAIGTIMNMDVGTIMSMARVTIMSMAKRARDSTLWPRM